MSDDVSYYVDQIEKVDKHLTNAQELGKILANESAKLRTSVSRYELKMEDLNDDIKNIKTEIAVADEKINELKAQLKEYNNTSTTCEEEDKQIAELLRTELANIMDRLAKVTDVEESEDEEAEED
ncbi:hypothetical protein Tco_0917125 [Tanacetum coccineum]